MAVRHLNLPMCDLELLSNKQIFQSQTDFTNKTEQRYSIAIEYDYSRKTIESTILFVLDISKQKFINL